MQQLHSQMPGYASIPFSQPIQLDGLEQLQLTLDSFQPDDLAQSANALQTLLQNGAQHLPLPAQGETLTRWQALSAVASVDLSLTKLYEAHTDAMAIMQEIAAFDLPIGTSWGVWCAEMPDAKVVAAPASFTLNDDRHALGLGQAVTLQGRKSWCSGATSLTHALVSATDSAGQRLLVAVALDQPGVHVTEQGWLAIGMANCASVDVVFDHAAAYQVGNVDAYLQRSGFWHGGAGIAACWYGAAAELSRIAANTILRPGKTPDPHKLAHLGSMDVALAGAAAVLRETAAFIDAHPDTDASAQVMRTRLAVEAAAEVVLLHAGRALGAYAFCRDAKFARLHADLTVFLKQSHGERDLAQLAQGLVPASTSHGEHKLWAL